MWADVLLAWSAAIVLIVTGWHLIRRTEKQHDTDQEGNQP